MIRSSRLVAHATRRGFSSTTHQQFLNRLQWPFRRRESPIQYRLQVVRPRYSGVKTFTRRFVRIFIGVSIVSYFLPVSISFSSADDENQGGKDQHALQADGEAREEDDELDDDEAGLFIPLSWPVQAEQEFYRGADPEWQEYVKFAGDKESQRRAHEAVVLMCRQAFIDTPQLASIIGKVDVTKGKFWLDVDFPLGPPPEYEQIGIEIGSGFVALAVQTLPQEDYNELRRIFDIKSIALSAHVTAVTAYNFIVHRLTGYFYPKDAANPYGASHGPGQDAEAEHRNSPLTQETGAAAPVKPSKNRVLRGDADVQAIVSDKSSHIETDENGYDSARAQQMFRAMFSLPFSTTQVQVAPPRGSIVLGGLVECHGTNMVATVDVTAIWDLTEEQILSHNAKVRHVTPRRIMPHPQTRMPPSGVGKPPPLI